MIHIDGPLAPPQITEDSEQAWCCWGSVIYGPTHCTCWEPIYDLAQMPLQNEKEIDQPETREKCCHDCAYKPNSPERAKGESEWLEEIAQKGNEREFWCHQGVRRVVAWKHPDGRKLEAPPGCYDPPQTSEGMPMIWKANGTPGERCAGWATRRNNV